MSNQIYKTNTIMTNMRLVAREINYLALVLLLCPVAAVAQGERPFDAGNGQSKGPTVKLVSYAELKSDEVQTIALVPGYHMVIEFPYPVARMDVGDDSLFTVSKYANKLTVKATSPVAKETSVTISMADADLTVIPFIFRVDPLAPRVQVLKYTDPIAQELNRAKARIAANNNAEVNQRVSDLAEKRMVQRLLVASNPTVINREGTLAIQGGFVRLKVETVQQIPGPNGPPRLYLRYRFENSSLVTIGEEDLEFEVIGVRADNKFWGKNVQTPYYDIEDTRTSATIRGGSAILGILSLDTPDLQKGETLTIRAKLFGGTKILEVTQALTGSGAR